MKVEWANTENDGIKGAAEILGIPPEQVAAVMQEDPGEVVVLHGKGVEDLTRTVLTLNRETMVWETHE